MKAKINNENGVTAYRNNVAAIMARRKQRMAAKINGAGEIVTWQSNKI
jgi:hypothetical protein